MASLSGPRGSTNCCSHQRRAQLQSRRHGAAVCGSWPGRDGPCNILPVTAASSAGAFFALAQAVTACISQSGVQSTIADIVVSIRLTRGDVRTLLEPCPLHTIHPSNQSSKASPCNELLLHPTQLEVPRFGVPLERKPLFLHIIIWQSCRWPAAGVAWLVGVDGPPSVTIPEPLRRSCAATSS